LPGKEEIAQFRRDIIGRVALLIRYAAVRTATVTADLHTYAAYDALYRPVRTETEYEPGAFAAATTAYGTITGQKEGLLTTSTDDLGKVTRTTKDGLQRPVSVTDAFATILAATTQTIYSSTGLVWKTIDPLNRESETEFDGAGRTVKAWQPDPVTGVVNRATPNDPLSGSPCTRTAYDKNNNVTVTLNALGFRWEYEYDARNRKTVEHQPSVTQTEIANGQPVETPFKNPDIHTDFDGVGNVISVTDARGHVTRTFRDNAYRVTDVLSNPVTGEPSDDPATPGANDIVVHTSLDANGNATEVTDGNGNATRNTYDLLNRLASTATNPVTGQPSADPASPAANDITVFNQYDDSNNLVQVTDGEGHVTGFRYDGLNRKTRTIWDEGSGNMQRVEQSAYDGLVLTTRTDPRNQVTTYEYDALHRLENILYTDASADNRHQTYNPVGNLLTVTYPNETESRQILRRIEQKFDKLKRLKEETSAGATHVHTYDKAGNRRTTTYAATGRYLVSTYDKLNRLLTCIEKPNVNSTIESLTSYAYDLGGNVTRKVLPNGSATQCAFDALNRKLSEDTRTAAGGLISSFDYSQPAAGYPSGHDNAGNLLKIVEFYGGSGIRGRTVTNTYDHTYRLATETLTEVGGTSNTTTYGYDTANNRISKMSPAAIPAARFPCTASSQMAITVTS
jgi:YD repeat-containing protein